MQKWIFDVRSRPFVLLAAAALACTLLVHSGAADGADESAYAFAEAAGGARAAMAYVTEAGDALNLLVLAAALFVWRRTRRVGVSLMIALVVVTLATGYVKCGVDRDRPEAPEAPDTGIPLSQDTFALFCEGGPDASYPSGHAARAAAFAVILGFALSSRFPRGAYLMLAYPAAVGVSRVALLEHYPSDVAGGIVMGLLAAGVLARKTRLDATASRP